MADIYVYDDHQLGRHRQSQVNSAQLSDRRADLESHRTGTALMQALARESDQQNGASHGQAWTMAAFVVVTFTAGLLAWMLVGIPAPCAH